MSSAHASTDSANQPFSIRQAGKSDLAGLLTLYRHLDPNEPPPPEDAAEASFAAVLEASHCRILVIETGGVLVASCVLVIVPNLTRGARPFALVENVVTHEAYRRRGFGRQVLQAAIDMASRADCYKIMLASGSKQESTLRFYESAGFVRGQKTFFQMRR